MNMLMCAVQRWSSSFPHTGKKQYLLPRGFCVFSPQTEEEMNNMKPTTLNILLLRHPLDITPRTRAVPISSLSPPLIFLPTDSKFPITLLGRAIQFSQTLSPKLRNTFQNPGPFANMPNGVELFRVPESILLHHFSWPACDVFLTQQDWYRVLNKS